jgi:hypothetical protein
MNVTTDYRGGIFPFLLNEKLGFTSTSVVLILTAILLQKLFQADKLSGIPILGEGGIAKRRKLFVSGAARDMYREGYKKVCNILRPISNANQRFDSDITTVHRRTFSDCDIET